MARTKAKQALDFVRSQARQCATARDLHNAFFGNGGMLGKLFPTLAERDAFWQTPEFREIVRIQDSFDTPKKRTASSSS
jgi:hypothetical protein